MSPDPFGWEGKPGASAFGQPGPGDGRSSLLPRRDPAGGYLSRGRTRGMSRQAEVG